MATTRGCILRRRPPLHPVRQHQTGGCPHPGRWKAAANARLHGAAIPLSVLQSHCLFEDRFGRPGKGNDKGKVEGLAGFIRRNFLVPVPRVESIEALNDDLAGQCRRRQATRLRGHGGDDRRAPRTGSRSSATATPGSIRCRRQASRAREFAVAVALPRQRLTPYPWPAATARY